MNANNLKRLMILVFPFIFACTTQSPVTPAQRQQLEAIYYQTIAQAKTLPRMTSENVEALLKNYDGDIQGLLNAEQWARYDSVVRDRWARAISKDNQRGGRPVPRVPR